MQAALKKKGNFFPCLVSVNRMSHLSSRAHRPLCLSTSKRVLIFLSFFHIFVVNSNCISVSCVSSPICASSESKPHVGDRRRVERLPLNPYRALHCHCLLLMAAWGERAPVLPCEENRCNKSKSPRGCLSSNIPVGHQMMWD